MQLTRRAEYAIRTMLDIAIQRDNQPVMSKEIAERQEVPVKFLIQIIPELKSAGLIHTVRGSGGGIYLAKRPSEINVRHIVEAIEGPIALNQCLIGDGACARKPHCPLHVVWHMAQSQMLSVLEATTLAQLAASYTPSVITNLSDATGARVSNEVEIEV